MPPKDEDFLFQIARVADAAESMATSLQWIGGILSRMADREQGSPGPVPVARMPVRERSRSRVPVRERSRSRGPRE